MSIPPSGEQFEIIPGPHRATLVEVGGGIRSYTCGERAVLDGYPAEAMRTGARGTPLIPWPNRLADGAYGFAGTDYQVALTEPEVGAVVSWRVAFWLLAVPGLVLAWAMRTLLLEPARGGRSQLTARRDPQAPPGGPQRPDRQGGALAQEIARQHIPPHQSLVLHSDPTGARCGGWCATCSRSAPTWC